MTLDGSQFFVMSVRQCMKLWQWTGTRCKCQSVFSDLMIHHRPTCVMSSQRHWTFLCQRLWWQLIQEQYGSNVYFNIANTVNNLKAEAQEELLNCPFGFEVPTAVTMKRFAASFVGFLFVLLFNPEDGVDIFLRNVGLRTTRRYNTGDRTLHYWFSCLQVRIIHSITIMSMSVTFVF
jgi:hypothetical protein